MRRAYLGLARACSRTGRSPARGGLRRRQSPARARARLCAAVVKGDAIVPAIMAASILAKVARDRAMERYDWLYPEYGYARHKGYPTAAHREALPRARPFAHSAHELQLPPAMTIPQAQALFP